MESIIEQAIQRERELAAARRVFHDAAFLIENALRNARIAAAGSPGLWRQALPQKQALVEVEAAIARANKMVLDAGFKIG